MTIGERLKGERRRLNLSGAAFADALGVSLTTQRLYESGRRSPSADYLARAAELGVDVAKVVLGDGAGPGAKRGVDDAMLKEILIVIERWCQERGPVPVSVKAELASLFYTQALADGVARPEIMERYLRLVAVPGNAPP